jgi:2-phospho-L-lactate/phosphoenolpyruvate guanylyltransferase
MIAIAAVPMKDLANAKQRLMGVLAPAQRAALARAMLEDVLRALGGATLRAVWVVTRDPDVIAFARPFSCTILTEPVNRGHTEAVALAQEAAHAAGAEIFLTVPGDVPCVTPSEIQSMLDAARGGRAAVFVPSASGHGTNGVVLRPPGIMTLKFGEPSFANHLTAARRRDVEPTVLHLPGLALDVDGPDDLQTLLGRGAATMSGHLVAGWRNREALGGGTWRDQRALASGPRGDHGEPGGGSAGPSVVGEGI